MHIDISQLAYKKGSSSQIAVSISEVMDTSDCGTRISAFLSPVRLEGTMTALEYGFLLEGELDAKVSVLCDRCLKPVPVSVRVAVHTLFCRSKENADRYQDAYEDEEIELFSGEELELTDVLRRNLLLGLPMKVVCKEDCKGLCPVCGKNLNEGNCECDTVYRNPKFESLLSLFQEDKEV